MSSPYWRSVATEIFDRIENLENQQTVFDALYNDLCKSLFREMDDHIRYSDSTKNIRKKFKNYKPYWSNRLREEYKIKQGIFHKRLRNAESAYNKILADDNGPVQFLNQINRLGPQKNSEIPMSVMRGTGECLTSAHLILETIFFCILTPKEPDLNHWLTPRTLITCYVMGISLMRNLILFVIS